MLYLQFCIRVVVLLCLHVLLRVCKASTIDSITHESLCVVDKRPLPVSTDNSGPCGCRLSYCMSLPKLPYNRATETKQNGRTGKVKERYVEYNYGNQKKK